MHEACIKVLNELIASELYGIMLYLNAAHNMKGELAETYESFFEDIAETEMKHMGQLAGFLTGYGGVLALPSIEVPAPITLEEALRLAVQAEEWATKGYADAIKLAEEVGNKPMEILFENLILEEEDHKVSFSKALGAVAE